MSGMLAEAIIQWRAALSLSGEPEQARVVEETFAASGFDAAVRALARKQLERLQEKTARGRACSRLSLHDGLYATRRYRTGIFLDEKNGGGT